MHPLLRETLRNEAKQSDGPPKNYKFEFLYDGLTLLGPARDTYSGGGGGWEMRQKHWSPRTSLRRIQRKPVHVVVFKPLLLVCLNTIN